MTLTDDEKKFADKLLKEFNDYIGEFGDDKDKILNEIYSLNKTPKRTLEDVETDVINYARSSIQKNIDALRASVGTSIEDVRNAVVASTKTSEMKVSKTVEEVKKDLSHLEVFLKSLDDSKSSKQDIKSVLDLIENLSKQIDLMLEKKYTTVSDVTRLINNHEAPEIPHAEEHQPGGKDVIPIVNDKLAGLMSPNMLNRLKLLSLSDKHKGKSTGYGGHKEVHTHEYEVGRTTITTVTSDYTHEWNDRHLSVSTVSGPVEITLRAIEARFHGKRLTIKDGYSNATTNSITLTPTGDTIDNISSFVLNGDDDVIDLVANYTTRNWEVAP